MRRTRTRDDRELRRELGEVERGIERCLDFIVSGDSPPGAVCGRLAELEDRKRSLEARLKTSPPERVVEIHPNFPELYRRKVGELSRLLADELERPRAVGNPPAGAVC